jgi:translation initiation factor IF-1
VRRPDAFVVEGLILDVLSERTCRVELANGHRLLGFLTGKARPAGASLAAGQKVRLRLSPADLSHGRILVDAPA